MYDIAVRPCAQEARIHRVAAAWLDSSEVLGPEVLGVIDARNEAGHVGNQHLQVHDILQA